MRTMTKRLRRYPGRVLSLHSDNGSEFMNGHLTRFCGVGNISFTRSRPYRGNDNAQTPCARMLARKEVAEVTKERLLGTRAELDMTSLLHEIFLPRGCCLPSMFSQCPRAC